jgi:AraC-like DNA-binding protein
MTVDLLDIISIITVFQLLLLAAFLVTYKKGRKLSNQILSAFLFSNALLIANFVLFRLKILALQDFPCFYFIGTTSYFLLMPLLYLYTKSLCYRDFALKRMHLIHLMPFVLCAAFLIIRFYIRSAKLGASPITAYERSDFIISRGTLHIQILLYIIATLRTLYVYRQELKKLFSFIEQIDLSWLLFLLFGFILMWLIDVTSFALAAMKAASGHVHYILGFFSLTINFVFATVIVYRGLKQPQVFSGIDERPKHPERKLTASEVQRDLDQLISYMKDRKPYLIPSLSLNELAEKLLMQPRYLSLIINKSLEQNFFDFVNSYRIEESKRIFLDPSNRNKTILEVLYEVGFNSKSVFNSSFKKQTGLTPTQFRKLYTT